MLVASAFSKVQLASGPRWAAAQLPPRSAAPSTSRPPMRSQPCHPVAAGFACLADVSHVQTFAVTCVVVGPVFCFLQPMLLMATGKLWRCLLPCLADGLPLSSDDYKARVQAAQQLNKELEQLSAKVEEAAAVELQLQRQLDALPQKERE
ncbi:ribonuclease Y [Chlorella sorokiniana]|uniref:Ribonuclease Y n=1 Tax=Chlorella sorokiniana TaxID=3076 RepID=A0A2P6TYM2_CHLSO|nr:ribonuclease Y [Chlorella sorokiniana]|eukprot:PRW59140.1 ribonuclease Y [Chlorella sorokiniana]